MSSAARARSESLLGGGWRCELVAEVCKGREPCLAAPSAN